MTEHPGRRTRLALLAACIAGVVALAGPDARAATGAAAWAPAIDCPDCNDFNACTVDSCDTGTGTCRHDPISCDDANPCTIDSCDTNFEVGGCRHVFAPAGAVCDDGQACTQADDCDATGHCAGDPLPEGAACDDRNPCTESDACAAGGACRGTDLTPGETCDDGDACTSGDACAAGPTGAVACQGARRSCDDGDPCTVDSCNPSSGDCEVAPKSCDDGNVCTADSCDPATGQCLRTAVSATCSDGTVCTTGDACSGGNCVGAPRVCTDIGCNDAQGCRWDRGCVYLPNPSLCGSGGECFGWTCNLNGSCQQFNRSGQICHAGSLCQVGICGGPICNIEINLCNDFNPCTTDVCVDPATGTCGHANLPDGAACNDGNPCTSQDTCQGGTCGGVPLNCDDGLACTADSCTATGGCVHSNLDGAACDDANLCTTGDTCHSGSCGGVPLSCDDGLACTVDSCDAATGCVHTPLSGDSDGDQIPDGCDNCPTLPNPDQNPCVCGECIPIDITISFISPAGKGSGLVSWRTGMEHDIVGFNVVVLDNQEQRTQLNFVLIPCEECITDQGSAYLFVIPKHKSGRDIYIEQVHRDGRVGTFGPAARQ